MSVYIYQSLAELNSIDWLSFKTKINDVDALLEMKLRKKTESAKGQWSLLSGALEAQQRQRYTESYCRI